MEIRWYPPLDRLLGSTSELPLAGPMTVAQVLAGLAAQEPGLALYARFAPGDAQSHGLLVCRRGEALPLGAEVVDDDRLEILLLITGG
ncbi:MAG: MoaD/ThiS family protein [Deferrisomatales bacterium]